ncbi:30S ribosomal protein S24e [Candidatus Gugararchaeum adminiculabundum]|nr:30S ribosomal protein S24e [Candidatus Gugararchaeum adminiculabundum]
MDIEIKNEKENKALERKEVTFLVKYDKATPSRDEVRAALAPKVRSKQELIVIDFMYPSYGTRSANGSAKVYANEAAMKIEPAYKHARGKPKPKEGEAAPAAKKKEKK